MSRFKSSAQRKAVMAKMHGTHPYSHHSGEYESKSFNPEYESALLNVMNVKRAPRSTRELAAEARMDWETANKYLIRLEQKGLVTSKKTEGKTIWKLKD